MESNYLSWEFECVAKAVNFSSGENDINKISPLGYYFKVIKRVDERENDHEIETINLCTGLVNVSILSNNHSMQSDPRISWIVSQDISVMYRVLKHPETLQA